MLDRCRETLQREVGKSEVKRKKRVNRIHVTESEIVEKVLIENWYSKEVRNDKMIYVVKVKATCVYKK